MTLNEAIKHTNEVAKEYQMRADSNIQFKKDGEMYLYDAEEYYTCNKSAEEYRQLGEYLKELKVYRDKKFGWIPVSEKLPNKETLEDIQWKRYVLVTAYHTFRKEKELYVTLKDANDLFDNPIKCEKITAWMPSPEPYQIENNEVYYTVPREILEEDTPEEHEECKFCSEHVQGDTLYECNGWDGGISYNYIRNIKYCPLCGKELKRCEGY